MLVPIRTDLYEPSQLGTNLYWFLYTHVPIDL